MTDQVNAGLRVARQSVEQMLGECLLRLQVYERGLKAILAQHDVSGPADQFASVQAAGMEETSRMTLGQLAGQLLGSYFVTGEPKPDDDGGDSPGMIRMRYQVEMPQDHFTRTQADLRDLVALRNRLVHHFFDDCDLRDEEGCRMALQGLTEARDRIVRHVAELSQWARELDAIRKASANYLRSEEFRDFIVDGLDPDGGVHWPLAGIVGALRDAAAELSEEGWTRLDRAIPWIATRAPRQVPERYGCRSWPQVLEESRAFDLRYHEEAGQRIARYRPRTRVTAS